MLDLFPKEIRPFIIPEASGELYYKSAIPEYYKINLPSLIMPDNKHITPSQKNRLGQKDLQEFVKNISDKIAKRLNLKVSL